VADVKARPYTSPLRAEQAKETRRRVRDAADTLFRERGFVATSMDDIATAAGVSRQTVFTAFGTKAGVLKDAFEVRLAGDDEPLSLAERPESRRITALTDPVELVHAQAQFIIVTMLRVLPLWPALVAGAASDPKCAELLEFFDRGRLEGPGELVDVLAKRGHLRRRRTRRKAKEAMYLVTNPNAIHSAVDLGWSVPELQRWLGECLVALLLDPTNHSDAFQ
jgi:AcrR family transcriptional regulator